MPIKTRLGVDSGMAATKKVPKKRPRSLTEEKNSRSWCPCDSLGSMPPWRRCASLDYSRSNCFNLTRLDKVPIAIKSSGQLH
jgi:hypothetical protein